MNKQIGSAHIVVVAAIVTALVGILGFVFWQNLNEQEATNENTVASSETDQLESEEEISDSSSIELAEDGTIAGSLTYPSEGIPPTMEVHAINLETNQDFSTTSQLEGSQYRYRVGYRISVPAGNYHVYASLGADADQRHYYNNLVDICDEVHEGCVNPEEKVVVVVEPGKDTKDIMAGWSSACLVEGRKQPTEKFDLPTC